MRQLPHNRRYGAAQQGPNQPELGIFTRNAQKKNAADISPFSTSRESGITNLDLSLATKIHIESEPMDDVDNVNLHDL